MLLLRHAQASDTKLHDLKVKVRKEEKQILEVDTLFNKQKKKRDQLISVKQDMPRLLAREAECQTLPGLVEKMQGRAHSELEEIRLNEDALQDVAGSANVVCRALPPLRVKQTNKRRLSNLTTQRLTGMMSPAPGSAEEDAFVEHAPGYATIGPRTFMLSRYVSSHGGMASTYKAKEGMSTLLGPSADHEVLFDAANMGELCNRVTQGNHVCVLALGEDEVVQASCGGGYAEYAGALVGSNMDYGLLPRALRRVFEISKSAQGTKGGSQYTIHVSLVQVRPSDVERSAGAMGDVAQCMHTEDLLRDLEAEGVDPESNSNNNSDAPPCCTYDHDSNEVTVRSGVRLVRVSPANLEAVSLLLIRAVEQCRAVAASSGGAGRGGTGSAHLIGTLQVSSTVVKGAGEGKTMRGKLQLVEVANAGHIAWASDSSGAWEPQQALGGKIDVSLAAFASVICAHAEASNQSEGKGPPPTSPTLAALCAKSDLTT